MPPWERATTDPARVRQWWSTWPWANIATPVGSRAGIIVLDADAPHGFDALSNLSDSIPFPTLVSRSGGGGLHYYYPRLDMDSEMTANGITVVGNHPDPGLGFYVLLPPSITVGRYEWA